MIKKCVMCGKLFDASSSSIKLCSKECINKYNDSVYKSTFIKRYCKECGEPFVTNLDKLYCSKECRQEAIERAREKRMIENNGFSSLDSKLRYCKKMGISYAEYQKKLTLKKIKGEDKQ